MDEKWDGDNERRVGEERRSDPPYQVLAIDSFTNGAQRLIKSVLWTLRLLLVVIPVAVFGGTVYVVNVVRDVQANQVDILEAQKDIHELESADSAIGASLSAGISEINHTMQGIVQNQSDLRVEVARNAERIRALERGR